MPGTSQGLGITVRQRHRRNAEASGDFRQTGRVRMPGDVCLNEFQSLLLAARKHGLSQNIHLGAE